MSKQTKYGKAHEKTQSASYVVDFRYVSFYTVGGKRAFISNDNKTRFFFFFFFFFLGGGGGG